MVGGTVGVTVGIEVGFGTAVGFAGTLVAVGADSAFGVGVALGVAAFSGVAVAGGFAVGAATCWVAVGAEITSSLSSDPEEQPIIKTKASTKIEPGTRVFFRPIFIFVSMLRRYLNQLRQYNDTQIPGLNHTVYFDNSHSQFKITTYFGLSDIKSNLTINYTGIEIASKLVLTTYKKPTLPWAF